MNLLTFLYQFVIAQKTSNLVLTSGNLPLSEIHSYHKGEKKKCETLRETEEGSRKLEEISIFTYLH